MNEETGRKSTNCELVPPWHFLRTHHERGEEVKKVKVYTNATSSPPSLLCQPPSFTLPFHNRCQSLFPPLHLVQHSLDFQHFYSRRLSSASRLIPSFFFENKINVLFHVHFLSVINSFMLSSQMIRCHYISYSARERSHHLLTIFF